MSVFDENGHVCLDAPETMLAVWRELVEDPDSKWERGGMVDAVVDGARVYGLEVNPHPSQQVGAPQEFKAFIGDYLVKLQPFSFGVIVKMSAAEYAATFLGEG